MGRWEPPISYAYVCGLVPMLLSYTVTCQNLSQVYVAEHDVPCTSYFSNLKVNVIVTHPLFTQAETVIYQNWNWLFLCTKTGLSLQRDNNYHKLIR